jgi:drug/metabolite transporter (DMT)-like permease
VGLETVGTLAEFASAVGILAAAACYALSGFIVKNAYRGVPAVTTSCISVGAGALLAVPFAVATPPTHAPGLRSVLSLLVLGALGTALAFVIFYRLIAEVGAGRAALVTYLVPPLSLAYGALLLGETITAAAVAGLLLILGGVGLAARRPAATAAPD